MWPGRKRDLDDHEHPVSEIARFVGISKRNFKRFYKECVPLLHKIWCQNCGLKKHEPETNGTHCK